MYTIGEFSVLSKVSARMLRYYDKIGLFKPSEIGQNGYRYYNDGDMAKCSAIKQFRRFQFTYDEICTIFSKNDSEYTRNALVEKIDLLNQTASHYGDLIVEMNKQAKAAKNTNILFDCPKFDILTGYRQSFLALCDRAITNDEKINDMISQLYKMITNSADLVPLGSPCAIFHQPFDEYEPNHSDIEVCIPVNHEMEPLDSFFTRMIDSGMYASSVYTGSYDLIGNAYVAMLNWIKENDYMPAGPTMEKYYCDGRFISSQNDYVTEICMPIARSTAMQPLHARPLNE